MIARSEGITVYHKVFDKNARIEKWRRYNYNAWYFGGKGAGIDKGYDNANDINVRIAYNQNKDLNIENFKIGDIIVEGTLQKDISTQQDLKGQRAYNITTIKDNNYGRTPHIHLGGK